MNIKGGRWKKIDLNPKKNRQWLFKSIAYFYRKEVRYG